MKKRLFGKLCGTCKYKKRGYLKNYLLFFEKKIIIV